jgi:hypothetical protein
VEKNEVNSFNYPFLLAGLQKDVRYRKIRCLLKAGLMPPGKNNRIVDKKKVIEFLLVSNVSSGILPVSSVSFFTRLHKIIAFEN